MYIYENIFFKLINLLALISVLSILLIILNQLLYLTVSSKSTNNERTLNKGLETYEFGAHSIGVVSTISSNQFIILGILFLLFDIELIFLIPWCIHVGSLLSVSNVILIILAHCVIYCLLVELHFNILVWYKGNNLFYV